MTFGSSAGPRRRFAWALNVCSKWSTRYYHLASADSRKRVIIQLLRLSRPIAENSQILEVIQGFSHDALASFVGLSRETVTRMITLLKRDGLIFQTQKKNFINY